MTDVLSGLFVLVALAFVGYRFYRSRVRRDEVGAIAAAKGWRFLRSEPGLVDRWPGRPFDRGEHQYATNVLRGSWGDRKFIAFDYSFEPTFNPRATDPVRRFSVVSMQLPAALPRLEVEHENLLGSTDLRFESEAFNQTFRVTTEDERYAHAVIHPRLMELLLDRGEIGWRIVRNDLLAWDTGSHSEADLERRLSMLAQIADLIPNFVYRDYGLREDL